MDDNQGVCLGVAMTCVTICVLAFIGKGCDANLKQQQMMNECLKGHTPAECRALHGDCPS